MTDDHSRIARLEERQRATEREIDDLPDRTTRLEQMIPALQEDVGAIRQGFEKRERERAKERIERRKRAREKAQERKADRRWFATISFTAAAVVIAALSLLLDKL